MVPLLYGRVLTAFMDCEDPDCDEAVKLANFERALPQYEKSFHLMRSNNWKSDLSLLNNVVQCLIEIRKCKSEINCINFIQSIQSKAKHIFFQSTEKNIIMSIF